MGISNSKCYYCNKEIAKGETIVKCLNCNNIFHEFCYKVREELMTNISCSKCKKLTRVQKSLMN